MTGTTEGSGVRTAGELRSVLDYVTGLLKARRHEQVQPLLLAGLADVVGSDSVTLTHLDPVGQHEVVVVRWPQRPPDPEVLSRYQVLGRTHPLRRPLLNAAARRKETAPLRVSQVLSARAWRRTAIYQHALRGVTDQWCLPIAFRGNQVQALTLTRTSGVFTDRQHALLAACGPHVRAAMDRGLLAGGTGLRLSEQPGWVPLERAPGLAPPGTLVTTSSRTPDDPDAPAIGARAISDREREVLTYVARGLTDAQIASRLGVRPATVSKHLHRVYRRHGLANRAAATRLLAGQPHLSDA